MAKTVADVMNMVKENEIKFVDFRFTDTRGKEQHVRRAGLRLRRGQVHVRHAFDGSSIAGWKGIEASDMLLMPDPNTANIDPFFEEPTLLLTCDVLEPGDGKPYERDPRSLAHRAEAHLKAAGIGDAAYFGPEPDSSSSTACAGAPTCRGPSSRSSPRKRPGAAARSTSTATPATGRASKGRLLPGAAGRQLPGHALRMCLILESLGVPVEVHHHEVATAGQMELGTVQHARAARRLAAAAEVRDPERRPRLRQDGDLHAQAHRRRQRLGMHVHQSVWKDGKNLFAGDGYAGAVRVRAVLHRRHHQARARAQRHHQPGTNS